MSKEKDYWFPAKTYGWGWGLPATWQGWLVMGAYLTGLMALSVFVNPVHSPEMFTLALFGLSAVLLAVCWKTGEPPRWRWGKE